MVSASARTPEQELTRNRSAHVNNRGTTRAVPLFGLVNPKVDYYAAVASIVAAGCWPPGPAPRLSGVAPVGAVTLAFVPMPVSLIRKWKLTLIGCAFASGVACIIPGPTIMPAKSDGLTFKFRSRPRPCGNLSVTPIMRVMVKVVFLNAFAIIELMACICASVILGAFGA